MAFELRLALLLFLNKVGSLFCMLYSFVSIKLHFHEVCYRPGALARKSLFKRQLSFIRVISFSSFIHQQILPGISGSFYSPSVQDMQDITPWAQWVASHVQHPSPDWSAASSSTMRGSTCFVNQNVIGSRGSRI